VSGMTDLSFRSRAAPPGTFNTAKTPAQENNTQIQNPATSARLEIRTTRGHDLVSCNAIRVPALHFHKSSACRVPGRRRLDSRIAGQSSRRLQFTMFIMVSPVLLQL
jgi:hypothetical protein